LLLFCGQGFSPFALYLFAFVFVKDLCSVILVIVEPGSIRGGVWKKNRFGAPNAIDWHTFLDLPTHTTILRTVRSTELPLFSSFTSLQKVFQKQLSTARAINILFLDLGEFIAMV
jgi:hypothetical protein